MLNKDLAKELLTVLPYFDDDFIASIPSDLLARLTDLAADSTKNFALKRSKSLNEQNLTDECKNWLSLLYYQFISPSEKYSLLKSWTQNDVITQVE